MTSTTADMETDESELRDCKFCMAPIRWARNISTGRGIPLDPDPVDDGRFVTASADEVAEVGVVIGATEIPVIKLLRRSDAARDGARRWRLHFDTCTNKPADRFK